MRTGIRVYDAMTKSPVIIEPDVTLEKCAERMLKGSVGSLAIIKGKKLLGIITEKDFIKAVAEGVNPKKTKVEDVMTSDAVCIEPWEDVYDALKLMNEKEVRRLPVIDEGDFIGLLTEKDVLKIAPQLFDLFAEKLKVREKSNKPILEVGDVQGQCMVCNAYSDSLRDVDGELVCENCR